MLVGVFEHNIEGKNRLSLPSNFREFLGGKVIYKFCNSEYPAIHIYNYDYFQSKAPSIDEIVVDPRQRIAYAQAYYEAFEGTVDANGRLLLKNRVLERSKINKQCLVIGCCNHVEVMAVEVYEEMFEDMNKRAMEAEAAVKSEDKLRNDYIAQGAYLDKGGASGAQGEL